MMQGINLEALGVVLYLPVWAVAILTLAVGALVGLVNGVLIAGAGFLPLWPRLARCMSRAVSRC